MGELREAIRASLERHIAESGYSQKEIAEKLGVSKSSVTNWIKGKNSPDVELVLPICKLLNISVREFYGEPDIEEPKKTKNAPASSQNDTEALSVDEVVAAFVQAGIVQPGKDLSNEDLRFLEAIISAVRQWFSE